MAYLLGVLVIVVGVPLSIALHEIGHLVPAKLFGVKCTQYMVGFGATLWSRRIGETEYGVKAIPLGGYVRMIGMYPPKRRGADASVATGRWSQMIEQARADARAEVGPDDADRQFYQRSVPQRIIVMLGGPTMNLLVAVLILAGLTTLYGLPQETTTVGTVSACVLPADAPASRACSPSDPKAPAAAAGLLPRDQILRFDDVAVDSWSQVRSLIRSHGDKPVQLTVRRGGQTLTLTMTPVLERRPVLTAAGQPVRDSQGALVTEPVGFAGIGALVAPVRQPITAVPGVVWQQVSGTFAVVLDMPAKMVGVAKAALGLQERDPSGPVSLLGVGRMAGEVAAGQGAAAESDATGRVLTLVSLLGGLNLALFVFNLIPLLPLDGGHVAGALWEGLRRSFARALHRPDPGPVDTARALPLVYAVASVLVGMGVLLIYADLVSPVKLGG